ncbi:magnesium-translocating P-type ATPase [Thiomonas sp. FB-Cd]|uniref:magnesium-translocating P-type ATPase n=1 Tax=Thiomonas sp. FB-Cd TaxID=1158292 RepID=UPI00068D33E4|nr:magnesium-translocating P-type ATPase [Thiomonas sp. FB-Cd]
MTTTDQASLTRGLSSAEATRRRRRSGPNQIVPEHHRHLVWEFLARFQNPLVLILLAAIGISALTGDMTGSWVIGLIVVASVTLDFFQEHRAGQAAERLAAQVAVTVCVLRDGMRRDLPLAQLVPGDVVFLSAGNLVPADGVALVVQDFFVNQAQLTGEPYPVEKHASPTPTPETWDPDAPDAILMGSSVVSGSATLLVIRTGIRTAFGQIATSLNKQPPATAFERGTRQFGILIMRLTFGLVLFVLLVNIALHRPLLESFLFAVALAVGLTPELLPMIVSVTLARGAMRMAHKKVIVKRLSAIQDMGAMDVLCTDKTGTLTEARIRLERHVNALNQESSRVLVFAYLNSAFETGLKSPLDDAILQHGEIEIEGWKKLDEVPFDFERRRVSVLLEGHEGRILVAKGAPEDILALCTDYEDSDGVPTALGAVDRERIDALFSTLGEDGFRILAIAWRKVPATQDRAVLTDESALVFAGFAAFLDPPKASAAKALAAMANGGVAIKIITGDNEKVTRYVCAQLGVTVSGVLTGSDIAAMNDDALRARVADVNIFCRANPAQKNRIILALKSRGHVVGYLGDGINDAPSLHTADVGISVNSAVDVAKQAAAMILLQNDLNVLHTAILEGRRTFGNVMKYIMMATSSNFGNMFSMAGAALVLPFLPMLPLQILLNNLLYDISEMPLPLDNVDDEDLIMPKRWDMAFIRNFMLTIGPISSVFDLLTFYLLIRLLKADEALFHTGWFVESIATQVLVIFVIRTRRNPLRSHPQAWLTRLSLGVVGLSMLLPFSPLANQLGFVPLPLEFFGLLIVMLLLYLTLVEFGKRWFYRRYAASPLTALARRPPE